MEGLDAKTPFYFVDLDAIISNANEALVAFRSNFFAPQIAFSYKTNCMQRITTELSKIGFFAEVVSGSELELALNDGFDGNKILFDGPTKSEYELIQALKAGATIQVDSISEVVRLFSVSNRVGIPPKATVRLATRIGSKWSRLGMDPKEVRAALKLFASEGISCQGIHFNSGAHRLSWEPYAKILTDWRKVIGKIQDQLEPAARLSIDVGGGFPAQSVGEGIELPSWEYFAHGLAQTIRKLGIGDEDFALTIEPGRAIVEDYGYLVMGVAATKRRGHRNLAILDGGRNLVNSMLAWDHPISIHPNSGRKTDLYGSMCFENDLFGKGISGPKVTDEHTRVIIGSCGGYDIPSARGWIRSLPEVWVKHDGVIRISNEKGTYNDSRIKELKESAK